MRRDRVVVFREGDIEVRRDPERSTGRLLIVDGMEASYVDLADPEHLEFSYVRRLRDTVRLAFPVASPLVTLHAGGGACTFPRYLLTSYPAARCEVWEAEPRVLRTAQRYLGLRAHPRLRVHLGDARAGLADRPPASADLVVGDAFVDGLPPAHLLTVEFAATVARLLRPGGRYLLNVVDSGELRLARRAAATLLEAFPEVTVSGSRRLLRGRGTGNVVLCAGAAPLPHDRLAERAARDPEPAEVLDVEAVRFFAAGARPFADPATAAVQA